MRFILCLLAMIAWHTFAVDQVRYVVSKQFPDPKQAYFEALLTKALETSQDKFGQFQLIPTHIEMAQERATRMLQRHELIDLIWRMSSQQLEQNLQPIYVPLLKGMMGYRIFIIRANSQQQFSAITKLIQLQKLPLGQGMNWPDVDILKANHFTVVQGGDNRLLSMLKAKRFDYYPRAIHEPWLEIANNPNFTVEQTLLLHYQVPIYFFVNKQNQRLASRLTYGLKTMQLNGEFDRLFYQHPVLKNVFQKSQINNRRFFHINNPLLTEKSKALLNLPENQINIEKVSTNLVLRKPE